MCARLLSSVLLARLSLNIANVQTGLAGAVVRRITACLAVQLTVTLCCRLQAKSMGRNTATFTDAIRVLPDRILSLLTARDLVRLACANTELRSLVYDSPTSVWEAAAR